MESGDTGRGNSRVAAIHEAQVVAAVVSDVNGQRGLAAGVNQVALVVKNVDHRLSSK